MKNFGTWAQNALYIKGFKALLMIQAVLASLKTNSAAAGQARNGKLAEEQLSHEIFPEGFWPRNKREEGDIKEKGGGITPFAIMSRIHYLVGLSPDQHIVGLNFGKKPGTDWIAFVFGNKAVVENAYYGNATYLFEADADDLWKDSLRFSKYEVWSRKAGHGFVKREVHQHGWEDRILDFLTAP
jgi:hypothetical protein